MTISSVTYIGKTIYSYSRLKEGLVRGRKATVLAI